MDVRDGTGLQFDDLDETLPLVEITVEVADDSLVVSVGVVQAGVAGAQDAPRHRDEMRHKGKLDRLLETATPLGRLA